MPDLDLIDHSPHHPSPSPPLANATNLVLIDNYDSFTWNVYQYLVLEGATVTVYRNDSITLAELIAKSPTQLVVSPGPGHPATDSGVSREAIQHFAGKIPVLGVCMGQQCIISVFGGEVIFAGEILHGKTSALLHDSKGVYENLAQELPVTRYHSLAGTHPTIPDCLEVSSWVAKHGSDEKGVIMGVRHKTYTVEGVQFHPESILTAEGRVMLKNFLAVTGGTWEENTRLQQKPELRPKIANAADSTNDLPVPGLSAYMFFAREQLVNARDENRTTPFGELGGVIGERWKGLSAKQRAPYETKAAADKKRYEDAMASFKANEPRPLKDSPSILDKIYAHRKAVVETQKQIPSERFCDLQASYNLNIAPPQISFQHRLKQSPYSLSLMAEIKRASPSKGIISLSASAPAQARTYALAGASVISVLTEPEWFKGSIEDLRAVRQSLEGMPNRPAVLRKEFIFDEYQILEARLAGADTILLIVKMLDQDTLSHLYRYSISLGMEPLVEVNTAEEMKIAVELGAKVIGVNNRNLKSFEVDLGTTSRLLDLVPEGTVVCALSGISGPKDVEVYKTNGVGAVLVGEALMRASDTAGFIRDLLGGPDISSVPAKTQSTVLVKICGTRTPEAAEAAIGAGADLVGIILVEGRRRCVPAEVALRISKVVHQITRSSPNLSSSTQIKSAIDYFQHTSTFFQRPTRALLVGVFQDQPLEYVLRQQQLLDLDIVQLHGSEPIEWAKFIPVPVIKSFGPADLGLGQRGYHSLPLLDSGSGGTGKQLGLDSVKKTLQRDPGLRVILAGGLDPNNVEGIFAQLGDVGESVVGVDVSSGVEEGGHQSIEKIREFIRRAKAIKRN